MLSTQDVHRMFWVTFFSLKGHQPQLPWSSLCSQDFRIHSRFLSCGLVYRDQTSIRVAGGAGLASHLLLQPCAGPQDTSTSTQPAQQDRGRRSKPRIHLLQASRLSSVTAVNLTSCTQQLERPLSKRRLNILLVYSSSSDSPTELNSNSWLQRQHILR